MQIESTGAQNFIRVLEKNYLPRFKFLEIEHEIRPERPQLTPVATGSNVLAKVEALNLTLRGANEEIVDPIVKELDIVAQAFKGHSVSENWLRTELVPYTIEGTYFWVLKIALKSFEDPSIN